MIGIIGVNGVAATNVFYGEYAEKVWYIDSLEVLANAILKASTADMPKF